MKNEIVLLLSIIVLGLNGCEPHPVSIQQQSRELIVQGLDAINRKDLEKASLDLQEAIECDPSQKEAYFLLGQIYLRTGQRQAAVDLLEHAAVFFPKDGTLFYLLAIAEKSVGRSQQAKLACQQSIEIFAQSQTEELYKNSMVISIMLWQSL